MFKAAILRDSIAESSTRLTTFELTYPRFIHSEFMTHRVFSRNASSSRAIPIDKMINDVLDDPVIPIDWGKNQRGMSAEEELPLDVQVECESRWLHHRDEAVKVVRSMAWLGLHKQIANRLLEPWMWITVIATVEERGLENFFKLRCNKAAEPHMQKLAWMMKYTLDDSTPRRSNLLQAETWHLPFVTDEEVFEFGSTAAIQKSVARCARGSYLQQHGDYNFESDVALGRKLANSGHWSPFEHQAWVGDGLLAGNFGQHSGWTQNRKTYIGEAGFGHV
jgi:thymidylate synthase ThyX